MCSKNQFFGFVLFVFSLTSMAQVVEPKLVISDLSVPWGMVMLPSGEFLITERDGRLLKVNLQTKSRVEISGVPDVSTRQQGGLLDIALHPDYKNNGWIYLSYSSTQGKGLGSNTAVMRAKIKDNKLVEQQQLYKAKPNAFSGVHFGSRIAFDKQGYLYFSIGDRGSRDENPQDIDRDAGKIYRLHDDGRIPRDNPFLKSKRPAIYSYGHRNPQGMAMNPVTGDIWTHEHGPRGGDEINLIEKGKNYGWPVITYGINYIGTKITDKTHQEGMEQPLWYWDPSIAPSGMTFVTSDHYSEWKDHLLVGSLKFGYLVLCKLDGNKVVSAHVLFEGIGRTRNVKQMPDGYIYVAVEGRGIYKLIPGKK